MARVTWRAGLVLAAGPPGGDRGPASDPGTDATGAPPPGGGADRRLTAAAAAQQGGHGNGRGGSSEEDWEEEADGAEVRHQVKERLAGHVSFEVAAEAVLREIKVPRTEFYKEKSHVNRIFVSKENPANRLAHTQEQLDTKGLPATDLTERYGTCAVVGNSGVLTLNTYGLAIDKHDVVIRFNDGPTEGFENIVGSRTTFRTINNNWSKAWSRKPPRGANQENLVLFGAGAMRYMHQIIAHMHRDRKPGTLDTKVWFMAPEFAGNARTAYKVAFAKMDEIGYMRVRGRNSAPTGIEGIFLAVELCDTVHLYGFGVSDVEAPYHYHDKVQGVEAAHSFGFQREFLKVLAKGGHITLCTHGFEDPTCNMGIGG